MIKAFTPIRFALCMMIFCHHAYGYSGGGASAVSVFFILSGFCLMLGYKSRIVSGEFKYYDYCKRRLSKIYPIHLLTLFVTLIVTFDIGQLMINKRMLLANLFLLQSWIPERSYYFSYNAIAWYLSTALFAYLCFPMIIIFLNKLTGKQRKVVFFSVLFAYCVVALAMPIENYHSMLYIHPSSRLVDFIIGIFLADFYMNHEWAKVSRYKILIDFGIILSFLLLNVIGIYAPSPYRVLGAIYWLPAASLILLTSISQRSLSILNRFMSSAIVHRITQCSFSMIMWSIMMINWFWRRGVANGVWGGRCYSSRFMLWLKLVII